METLYRRYRPQTFADVIGQEHVKRTLQNQLKTGSVGHAYLFTGPRGVGKTTTARLLAKAVNCLNPGEDGEPCNTCEGCLEVIQSRSLDVIEMDAASNTGVDHVREHIIEHVRFAPVARAFKVFIIDEVHMLSTSAFNALLKTLEEPPAHALFILATTEIHKVPETIISRTQRFDFRRIPSVILMDRLKRLAHEEGVDVDASVLEEIARQSEGSQRDAESLLSQVLAIGEKTITLELASLVLPIARFEELATLFEAVGARNTVAGLACIDQSVEHGIDLTAFLDDAISFARLLVRERVLQDGTSLASLPESVRARAGQLVGLRSVTEWTEVVQILLESRSMRSRLPQLPLELALARMCASSVRANTAPTPTPSSGSPVPVAVSTPVQPRVVSVPAPPQVPSPPAPSVPVSNREVELEPVTPEALAEVMEHAEIALPEMKDGQVTFRSVQGKWDEVFRRVAEAHTSLGFLLKSATLIGMEGDHVRLGFDFQFHADTLNAVKNREKLESVLQKVFGAPVRVRGEYVHATSDQVVEDVVSALGGRLVEGEATA